MLLENLTSLIGELPAGSFDIAWCIAGLILLYILDEFISLIKIAFRGLR